VPLWHDGFKKKKKKGKEAMIGETSSKEEVSSV
jgi:hypothetical protein